MRCWAGHSKRSRQGEASLQARLLESYLIAPDVKHFLFDVPGTEYLPYVPGQFVSLTRVFGERRITRAYSTASVPVANRFELCLNRVQDGHLSPWLFDMHPGDTIDMKGPLGSFTWRNPDTDVILVATGTGIAPFRGMIRWYLEGGGSCAVTLVFGVRYRRSLLYEAEFRELEREYPNFRFWPTLTRPDDDWDGRTGRVQQWTLDALGVRRDIDVYMCGMKAMVDDLRAQLKAAGLDRRHIIFEKYD